MEDVIGRARSTTGVDDDMDLDGPWRDFWGTLWREWGRWFKGDGVRATITITTTTKLHGDNNGDDGDFEMRFEEDQREPGRSIAFITEEA